MNVSDVIVDLWKILKFNIKADKRNDAKQRVLRAKATRSMIVNQSFSVESSSDFIRSNLYYLRERG